jgi:hypothetical protein
VREHKTRIDQLESRLNEITQDAGNGAANTPKDAPIHNYLITTQNPDDARKGNAMSPSPDSLPKTANETSIQPITESPNGATINKAAAASTTDAVAYHGIVDASTTRPPPEPAASAASNAPTITVIHFAEPFSFELYMYEKDKLSDGFTFNLVKYINNGPDGDAIFAKIDACNFTEVGKELLGKTTNTGVVSVASTDPSFTAFVASFFFFASGHIARSTCVR